MRTQDKHYEINFELGAYLQKTISIKKFNCKFPTIQFIPNPLSLNFYVCKLYTLVGE
jgi:hypothetical protein